MEILIITLTMLIISTGALQTMLYVVKENSEYFNLVFMGNAIFSILISLTAWIILPYNHIFGQVMALCFGLIGICSIVLKINKKQPITLVKSMLTVSISCSVISIIC